MASKILARGLRIYLHAVMWDNRYKQDGVPIKGAKMLRGLSNKFLDVMIALL